MVASEFGKKSIAEHLLSTVLHRNVLDLASSRTSVKRDLSKKQIYLSVSSLDQADKLTNHARAFANKGCESLVLICEISAGSGVTGKLGVAGGSALDVMLQACNASSISSAPSLQGRQFLRVVISIFLLGCGVLNCSNRFPFCRNLRLLRLGRGLF